MPQGKPAGVRCAQLLDDERCAIFGSPQRPACCAGLQASEEMCGQSVQEALCYLSALEKQTAPV